MIPMDLTKRFRYFPANEVRVTRQPRFNTFFERLKLVDNRG